MWNYDFQITLVFHAAELTTNFLVELCGVLEIMISTPFPFTTELSTNSLRDFVVLWNSDFQTVFHTAELSTNSLVDFVMFWNSDFHMVFNAAEISPIHHVAFWKSGVHGVQV